jgi:putative Mn2+ efflux pump MntP
MIDAIFIINAVLFGAALAMDAFSVALTNGMSSPCMKFKRMLLIAGTFAFFQAAMPLAGWFLVTRLIDVFNVLSPAVPYVALALLSFIGGKMIFDALRPSDDEEKDCTGAALTIPALLLQGLATSIDALSVGLTISHLTFPYALLEAGIIAAVTLAICLIGIVLGKKFGTHLGKKANILGGVILIAIGFEILISSFFA